MSEPIYDTGDHEKANCCTASVDCPCPCNFCCYAYCAPQKDREATAETVHLCPHAGRSVMPCCGKLVLEAPRTDRITLDPELVTCGG